MIQPCRTASFCSIVLGEARSWNVYEDEWTVAFSDIGQATPGHTIVVPRDHANDIWVLSEDDAVRTMRSVHQVAHLLQNRRGILIVGINIAQSNGRVAWQEVFHYHVHIVPRYLKRQVAQADGVSNRPGEQLGLILGSIARGIADGGSDADPQVIWREVPVSWIEGAAPLGCYEARQVVWVNWARPFP